jgi:NADH dehydrogenase
MPSFERKFRIVGGWWNNFWLGRDIATLQARDHPRAAFEEFASRPAASKKAAAKPAIKKAVSKPAAKKAPASKPAAKKPVAQKAVAKKK